MLPLPAGGAAQGGIDEEGGKGLSPRVRVLSGVYPRVCGGALQLRMSSCPPSGLSPRVRGSPATTAGFGPPKRSIPACAGEPLYGAGRAVDAQVYPRVCGGSHDHT